MQRARAETIMSIDRRTDKMKPELHLTSLKSGYDHDQVSCAKWTLWKTKSPNIVISKVRLACEMLLLCFMSNEYSNGTKRDKTF